MELIFDELEPINYIPTYYEQVSLINNNHLNELSELKLEFCQVYQENEMFYFNYIKKLQIENNNLKRHLKTTFELLCKIKKLYDLRK